MQQRLNEAAGVPRLDARLLRKSFGAFEAVRGVSLTIQPGEIHGLCGPNGAGKSTVVKMLSGRLSPDDGQITVDGRQADLHSPQAARDAGVALVDQELSVVGSLTVEENLALGGTGRRVRDARRLLEDVGLGHLDPRAPLERLTLGERQLVEIARALGRRSSIMILDEPTATLSDVEIERVFRAVRRVAADGRAVIFVSHRLGEVLDLCDRVTVIRDGEVVATTATAHLTINGLISQMIGGEIPDRKPRLARPQTGGNPLRLSGFTAAELTSPTDLTAVPGTIYALAGQVGSGAAALTRAIGGLEPSARGGVTVGGQRVRLGDPAAAARAGIAYVSGDRKAEGLFLDRTVTDNLLANRWDTLSSRGVVRRGRARDSAARIAVRAGISPRHLDAPVASLSGGNQQKVSVGRTLERDDVRVLVLDEPTRGVDVAGRAIIHDLIRGIADTGLAVVFSSTDLDEVVGLGDVVITFWGGRVVNRYGTDHHGPDHRASGHQGAPVASSTVLADITHREGATS